MRGDTTASARQALDVKARDSLSGFSLELEHSDSLTPIRAGTATQTELVGTVVSEKRVAQPMPALPSSNNAVPASGAGPRGLAWPDPVRSDITGGLDAMQKTVKDSGIDLAKSGRLLVKALQRFLQSIAEEPGNEPAQPALEEISTRLPGHLQRADD